MISYNNQIKFSLKVTIYSNFHFYLCSYVTQIGTAYVYVSLCNNCKNVINMFSMFIGYSDTETV